MCVVNRRDHNSEKTAENRKTKCKEGLQMVYNGKECVTGGQGYDNKGTGMRS